MMYSFSWPPLAFVVFLVVLAVWRNLKRRRRVSVWLRECGFFGELVAQPTVIFCIFLIVICVDADWVYSLDSILGLLDPKVSVLRSASKSVEPPEAFCAAMLEAICKTTVCHGDTCAIQADPACMQEYPQPCDAVVFPSLLRWICLLSPPCVILATVIAMWHSWKHLQYGRPWQTWDMDIVHSHAVQICFLAPVYGIFSLMSVVHMVALLQFRTDTQLWSADAECDNLLKVHGVDGVPQHCWAGLIDRSERWYNLNFLVADLYEARVLVCFGELCMAYIDLLRRRRVIGPESVTSGGEEGRTRGLLHHSCPSCKQVCSKCNGENFAVSHVLLAPLKTMTLQGLDLFVWTNYARSGLMISLEVLRMHRPSLWEAVNNQMIQMGGTDAVWTGFVLCVSSLAIWNLVTFESYLQFQLEDFKPFMKFLSAKIVVSLAFVQQILLKCFFTGREWKSCQQNLAYAGFMSIEVLLVAVLQYHAWNPEQLERIAEEKREQDSSNFLDPQPLDVLITRGSKKLQVTVAEINKVQAPMVGKSGDSIWHSASVTLLEN